MIGLLPWFIILYRLIGKNKTIRAVLLLLANSLFYVWGGVGAFVFVCCYSALIWLFSLILYKYRIKFLFALFVIISAFPLIFIKYTEFVITNINSIFGFNITSRSLVVPIGISFFTFEAISLIADIYKKETDKKLNAINVFLYLTFFPTVTSGPIIRYNEFEEGLLADSGSVNYTDSIERIIIGLCKKVLIADKIAALADYYFDGVAAGNSFSVLGLWIGSMAYTLQLYFDFSGYSDMAIGIGQLLGFDIRENFNRPYQASSISDFWKRWHISLTQWFRDYVYIPLGGNRCSVPRHIINMLIVWLLTGIWHGADWSFIIWGLGYFVLLLGEKYIPFMKKIGNTVIGHFYALFFINLLWIPFRANNINTAAQYLKGMFGNGAGIIEEKAVRFLPFFIIAILLCFPLEKAFEKFSNKKWFMLLKGLAFIIIFFFALCASINSSYAPYIYGNF